MDTFRETYTMFKRMEIYEHVYKGQTPSERYLGQMPNVTVMSGGEREYKLTTLTTPRRAAMASARQKMRSL